ncbi:MAG: glycolate oxidase subunit GlcE [Magnetospiraceae bacterium]
MPETFSPSNPQEIGALLADRAASGTPLKIRAGGSKSALGHAVAADDTLDLSALNQVHFYEPEELVLSAAAATPLRVVEDLLAQHHQRLAFEPPDLGPLLGAAAGAGTFGGIFACALSGPRRFAAGAARDHVMGVEIVNGAGDIIKSGGRVMKNVTGFDLCKLMTGAQGTLGVLTTLIVKTLPVPEDTRTLFFPAADCAQAVAAMAKALATPTEISGAVYLPDDLSPIGTACIALRLEGTAASVAYRADKLEALRGTAADATVWERADSLVFWQSIRDISALVTPAEAPLWRLHVAPMAAPTVIEELAQIPDARWFLDWAGGLIWLSLPPSEDAHAPHVRGAVGRVGGRAVLFRAPAEIRSTVPLNGPADPVSAALITRLRHAFDPQGILNPGRLGSLA